jgi:hypothetical protein
LIQNVRHDWTTEQVEGLYHLPLTELLFRAQTVHRRYHEPDEIQRCTLLSIKTGGCPEDCAYCPQSAHYRTGLEREEMLDVPTVLAAARTARQAGSTRFCMGAAWREVRDGGAFDEVLEMVEGVAELGMEVCVTLGMLSAEQAKRLKAAGLTAYNHNLDTSPEFYPEIITTRTYDDRLATLARVQDAGISVCCGGIVGMGESARDRCALLAQHADTLGREQACDGIFNPYVRFVVPHASENAVRRSQARQHTNSLTLGFRVPTNIVPGQRDQVWFQSVGDGNAAANVVRGGEGTKMNVGKLGDAKTLKGFGQAGQANPLTNHFHVLPLVKKPIAGSDKRSGAD